jgi:acetoacetyl-CoA synthetase
MAPLWIPTAEQIAHANMTRFIQFVRERYRQPLTNYEDLYAWSIREREHFWDAIWDFCDVIAAQKGTRLFTPHPLFEKNRFFPDARLNYAENLLRPRSDPEAPAILFWREDHQQRTVSFSSLYEQVARVAAHLRTCGVMKGDRVAGLVPNIPEAIVGALATASLGAIWSSCSPEFGVQGILDRFGQVEPKVLFIADGYYYKGKIFSTFEKAQALFQQLSTLQAIITIRYTQDTQDDTQDQPYISYIQDIGDRSFMANQSSLAAYEEIIAQPAAVPLSFEPVAFDHPLFIMFSSGTTGVPKCIVHGHGGTLLQHLKEHQLHCDLKPGDRLFYFTTTSWMMWNWLLSGLASHATLVLYEGSPFYPHSAILLELAETLGVTHFGVSAKYIDALKKAGVTAMPTYPLRALRLIASTGSPLAPESFDYVYKEIAPHACLASISGGTDILSCFALGNPIAPVWRGELQTRGLGMAVDVYDEQGAPVRGQKGELVCTQPFPSMPVCFWNDPDGSKYHKAYFERYPNVWHHGDYVELTAHNGLVIFGRSDAVLNPGGIRIGTAEIYRQVENVDEVLESLVVSQEWEGDERIVLFVKLRPECSLTAELQAKIRQLIRNNTTVHHVPAVIVAVADIPRTVSGKIVELAVRDIIHGRPVRNRESLANPEALELFKNIPELHA